MNIFELFKNAARKLQDGLEFDGMDLSDIVSDIDNTWHVKSENFTLTSEATVFDLAEAIASNASVATIDVLPRLKVILGNRLSRHPTSIIPTARLIRDLGMR